MSQQYPHNQQPQQPQQPYGQQPYGQQPYGQQYAPPPPPPQKKSGVGKILGLGCAGIIGLCVLIGIIAGVSGGSDGDSSTTADEKPASTAAAKDAKGDDGGKAAAPKEKKASSKTVTFKVWGTAPAGALGPIDITYGSDSDNRQGTFKNGSFTATLPVSDKAMFYDVTAQLQGSGELHCSVTIGDHKKTGHASGGYNICSAQLNDGLLGGWD